MNESASSRDVHNRSFYDSDAESYDQARWTSWGGALTNRVQQSIVDGLCQDWVGSHVLEVGPGTGRFSIPLLRKQNRLTLLDVSPGMLRKAAANIESAGLSNGIVALREGSIYELPFSDGTFDHAVSLNVFNHLERPADALRELARVVRPGATLLFNYANLRSYYWPVALWVNRHKKAVGKDVYSRWEKPGEMAKVIRGAGLELLRMVGHVHVPQALEPYRLDSVVRFLDGVSRNGPLRRFASFHFCMCRKVT